MQSNVLAAAVLGWSNDIHPVIAPTFMLPDLLIAPGRRSLQWRTIGAILAYPPVWVACTLLRGPHLISPSTGTTPWHPYPFLDPTTASGGYAGVAAWVAGIAALIAVISALVLRFSPCICDGEPVPWQEPPLTNLTIFVYFCRRQGA